MSPLSTNASLCRLLILLSIEYSRACMMYHSLIARRTLTFILQDCTA